MSTKTPRKRSPDNLKTTQPTTATQNNPTPEQVKPLLSFANVTETPEYKYGVCVTKLTSLFKSEQDVFEWLNSHESRLPKTPMQYMEEGDFEKVEWLIGMIEHGIPY